MFSSPNLISAVGNEMLALLRVLANDAAIVKLTAA
jgi:hypothetical protein